MPPSTPSMEGISANASISPFLEFFFFSSFLGLLVFFFFLLPEQQDSQQHHLGKQLHVLVAVFFGFGAS